MKINSLSGFCWISTIAICYLIGTVHSDQQIDDVKLTNHRTAAKKYYKKLKDGHGTIRLVGGLNEYEGLYLSTSCKFMALMDLISI